MVQKTGKACPEHQGVRMNPFLFRQTRKAKILALLISVILLLILGVIDYITGYQVQLAVFYLIPISLVVLYFSPPASLGFAFAGMSTMTAANLFTFPPGHSFALFAWNYLVISLVILLLTGLLAYLKYTFQKLLGTNRALSEANRELQTLNLQLNEKVEDAIREIREKDKLLLIQSRVAAMGEMLNNISHQWKQPLNTLALLLQNIDAQFEMGLMDKEKMEKYIHRSMDLILHMSKTVDDFRSHFKPESGMKIFPVKNAIEKILDLIEPSLTDENISVDFHADRDYMIRGYSNELGQVLLNLIQNSIEAFHERTVDGKRITIAVSGGENAFQIHVMDNAGGIPEEIMNKVYDPYFTTKASGTGIGLYMSKMIIEQYMDGNLTVRNTPEGADFGITLNSAAISDGEGSAVEKI